MISMPIFGYILVAGCMFTSGYFLGRVHESKAWIALYKTIRRQLEAKGIDTE